MRTQEIRTEASKARQDLARAEADFKSTLARNLEVWAQEEEKHAKRVREMKIEIDNLEAQKYNAIIPFDVLKRGSEEQMEEAQAYLAKLRDREDYNNDLTEKLQNKLDEVGQREVDMVKIGQKLDLKKENLEWQEANFKDKNAKLTQKMEDFVKESEQKEREIKSRETAISLQERTLLAKEDRLIQLEKSLNELAIRLADERQTLDRAWKEVKRLKNIRP